MAAYDAKSLLERAREAAANSYAPYSNAPKGAALLASDGTVYASGNIEFATFGGSVCAELGALTLAVNEGKRDFTAIALHPHRYPCGNCRQFLSEFGLGIDVITAQADGSVDARPLPAFLPNSFGKSNLG